MSYNILVVDDSSIIRNVVKKSIEMSGVDAGEIYEASNGDEALAVLRENWVDIVMSDINMPHMNGVELVRRMSEDRDMRAVPVVIISTERSETRIEELRKHGIKGYLTKPFRPEEIRDLVHGILDAP